jgi:hypothetical protein
MAIVLEVALGIVLACAILANWRGIVGLGALLALFISFVALLAGVCWVIYGAGQAIASIPPWPAPGSMASGVVGLAVSVLANLVFAFAVGVVLRERTQLHAREAHILGAVFYVLFLASAMTLPVSVSAYSRSQQSYALLLLIVLCALWFVAVRQSVLRIRARKAENSTQSSH